MADLLVMYDADLDLAALIDVSIFCAIGPTAPGRDGAAKLQQFASICAPFADVMARDDLMSVWVDWFRGELSSDAETPSQADPGSLGSVAPPDAAAAMDAAREAADGRGTPPEPGPADADMDADSSPTDQVVTCWNCNGDGTLIHGDTRSNCNMCRGTGKVFVGAPAS